MSIARIESSMFSASWKRVLWAVLGVPALVLGFLLMHSLSSDTTTQPDSHVIAQTLASPSSAASPEASSLEAPCDAFCATAHDAIGVVCMLGIALAVALLLPSLGRAILSLIRRLPSPVVAYDGARPRSFTSLELLSISRT